MEYTNTGRRPKSYRTECRAVFFSIIYPETVKLIYKEILDRWNLFLFRPFQKVAMTPFSNTSYGKNYLIQTNFSGFDHTYLGSAEYNEILMEASL